MLHDKDASSQINLTGKIAGASEIGFEDISGEFGLPSFISTVLYGNIWVHLTRIPIYLMIFIAFWLLLVMAFIAVLFPIDLIKKKLRRDRFIRLVKTLDQPVSRYSKILEPIFVESGRGVISDLDKVLDDEGELRAAIKDCVKWREYRDELMGDHEGESSDRAQRAASGIHHLRIRSSVDVAIIDKLEEEAIVKINDDGNLGIDQGFVDLIKEMKDLL